MRKVLLTISATLLTCHIFGLFKPEIRIAVYSCPQFQEFQSKKIGEDTYFVGKVYKSPYYIENGVLKRKYE